MSKQMLRLTENDLHKIIKESVNKILSELNWKTYDRASKQDYDPKRSERFARKLAKAHDEFKNIDAEYKDGSYQDKQLNTDFHKFLGKK